MKKSRLLFKKILHPSFLPFLLAGSALFSSCQNTTEKSFPTEDKPTETSYSVPQSFASVEEVILNRRSIRKYKPQDIDSATLYRILNCGIHAPNGKGIESWQVRIVRKGQLMNRIQQAQRSFTGDPEDEFAFGAPVVLFIAHDKNYDLSQVDCGLLGQNLMIAAQASGLGSCCLGGICRTLRMPENAEILQQLEIPETHRLLYAIALGYPDQQPPLKKRHWDRVKEIKD